MNILIYGGGAIGSHIAYCLYSPDNKISLVVDGKEVGLAEDDSFSSGGAGFFVEKGTILADGFLVQKT